MPQGEITETGVGHKRTSHIIFVLLACEQKAAVGSLDLELGLILLPSSIWVINFFLACAACFRGFSLSRRPLQLCIS